ncbi:MAG: hypothetical protein VX777_05830 [Chlamydiota bacterium]|nr:hypothetical protein [Chlamydiota bacterium]
MGNVINQTIGIGPDFSKVAAMKYNGPNQVLQKLLETSFRICDLDGIKLALKQGATPEPRLIDQTIIEWKKGNSYINPYAQNGLFTNRSFLPVVNLLQASLPKVSVESLETLHKAFRSAYFSGAYHETVKFKMEENGKNITFTRKQIMFTDFEYSMITKLFPIIRNVFKEKMSQLWINAPKQQSELSVKELAITIDSCHPCSRRHICQITLSNGKQVEEFLTGKDIICLIKATPHSKLRELYEDKEIDTGKYYGPERYYKYFNEYDSIEITPQFAENKLKKLFKTRVRIATNDEYFDLLRKGVLNEVEKISQQNMRNYI